MLLTWSTESSLNQLNNKVYVMKSTLNPELHATDSSQNIKLTEILMPPPLMFVTKPLPTPKDYQLMLKNNQQQLLLNLTVLMPEWSLDKNKETEKTPLGLLLMLNTPTESTLVKMPSTLLLPSQEDPSSSNSKEELRVLPTDLSK